MAPLPLQDVLCRQMGVHYSTTFPGGPEEPSWNRRPSRELGEHIYTGLDDLGWSLCRFVPRTNGYRSIPRTGALGSV